MSEQIELASASRHRPANSATTPWVRPLSECRALLMVASNTVTLRPPTMPRKMDAATMSRKGLSRANSSPMAPRVGWVMEDGSLGRKADTQ
ncbi:hypothetical protein D3C84_872250 [compost metagenome]